jgi:hypothetical protein
VRILTDFQGREVRLSDERWRHILDHPEMAGMEAALEETLRNPELVIRSRSDPAAALCYRYYQRTLMGGKWLCVVVKYDVVEPFVLTAYLTDKPKEGELLWRRP